MASVPRHALVAVAIASCTEPPETVALADPVISTPSAIARAPTEPATAPVPPRPPRRSVNAHVHPRPPRAPLPAQHPPPPRGYLRLPWLEVDLTATGFTRVDWDREKVTVTTAEGVVNLRSNQASSLSFLKGLFCGCGQEGCGGEVREIARADGFFFSCSHLNGSSAYRRRRVGSTMIDCEGTSPRNAGFVARFCDSLRPIKGSSASRFHYDIRGISGHGDIEIWDDGTVRFRGLSCPMGGVTTKIASTAVADLVDRYARGGFIALASNYPGDGYTNHGAAETVTLRSAFGEHRSTYQSSSPGAAALDKLVADLLTTVGGSPRW